MADSRLRLMYVNGQRGKNAKALHPLTAQHAEESSGSSNAYSDMRLNELLRVAVCVERFAERTL